MKKTLSLILALLMSASCAATIFADEAVVTSAIAEDAPAAEEEVVEAETEYDLAIEFLEAKKIMQGKGDGLLHVEDAVKRYEMAIFAARVATGWVTNDEWMNGTADNTKFNDLEGSGAKDALGALSYANQNGIVVGYPDGSFKPEKTVTYREALAMAVRTLGYTGLEYPWGIIEKAVTLGLTDDITGVAYTDTINRGVAAQIIYNALFAKTAGNKTLAMESFGCEYGWETIVVVADDKVVYEVGLNDTKDASGIVAFKLVNDNGTFGAETFNVKADLAFGGFYNALFEIDADAELVDLVKAIEIEPEIISNRGNDLETADAIGDFLKDYTLVEKYNVKNLSKTTLYDDELILKGEEEKTVITNWDADAAYIVAFDWDSGDIIELDKDGKYVKTLWNYNAEFDYYFRKVALDDRADEDEPEYFGIDIMDEKDVAELRAFIKDAKANKLTDAGYDYIDKYATTPLYADLTVWNLNNDNLDDYAIYEEYKFGKYDGINKDDDCDVDNSTAHKLEKYVLGGNKYTVEGTCAHHDVKGAHYGKTYTWAEGFEPSEGYTGYVIYGVDNVKNELKIVKEIAELGKNVDEDSYVSYGIVRGFNTADKKVTIGEETFSWDISGLVGVDAASAAYYDSLFNQFVKYVIVDGKLAHIEVSGASSDNFIVVERYLGIDNDGYIVIQGYTTNDCVLAEFRIGAYDGWKQGSAFFYPEESKIAEKFVKGNVYQITSTDTTEDNGKVYYVTALAVVDEDNQTGDLELVGIATDADWVEFDFEEGYREKTVGNSNSMKKMSADDVYVLVGEYSTAYNFKPVYFFKGIVPDDWSIEGNLVVEKDHLFVFVNATVAGFWMDTYKTGFIATLDGAEYVKVGFDGYMSDYYYYGATTYKVKAFDLIKGDYVDSITGYNLDLEDEAIYVTIDGAIVDDEAAYTWEGFKDAMFDGVDDGAYVDQDASDTADYVTFDYPLTAANDTKAAVSEYMSTRFFGFSKAHDDLVDEIIIKVAVVEDDGEGNLVDVVKLADAKIDLDEIVAVNAYAIYRANDKKVVLYVEPWTINNKPVVDDTTTAPSTNVAVVAGQDDDAYIEAVAGITTTTDDGVKSYTLDSITFNWTGKATADRHNAIDLDNFHFGDAGLCTIENWMAKVDVKKYDDTYVNEKWAVTPYENDGSIVAATYADHAEDTLGCDLVKKVTFKLATPVALKAGEWQMVQVVFFANEAEPETKTGYVFTACATVKDGAVYFAIDDVNGTNRVDGETVEIIARAEMDK